MSALSKLDQANALKKTIEQLEKKIDLTNKIVESFKAEDVSFPLIGMRCNPARSTDVIMFDTRYIPVGTSEFVKGYLKNMDEHKLQLQNELNNILN